MAKAEDVCTGDFADLCTEAGIARPPGPSGDARASARGRPLPARRMHRRQRARVRSESPGRSARHPLLELRGVNKSFGAVQVLHDVDFAVYPGEVTALVGDNGAGKSTLVKCIAGIYRIDTGEFLFEGKPVQVHGPRDAAALGIEVVYQDLALCDNLDIVQNMFLGRERKTGIVLDEATMEQAARETLAALSVRTVKSVRQQRGQPLRWPAADRGHRQGGAVELQGRDPRRADRGARRRPDPAGARPRPPARRQRASASCSSRTTWTTSSRSPTGSPRSTSAGWPPTCPTRGHRSQVVELITAGRSGDLGIAETPDRDRQKV